MTETTSIRTSIIGGFDRRDVIDNIKRISSERNALQKEVKLLTEGCESLTAQLTDTLAQLDAAAKERETLTAQHNAEREALIAEHNAELAQLRGENERLAQYKAEEQHRAAALLHDLESQLRVLREGLE